MSRRWARRVAATLTVYAAGVLMFLLSGCVDRILLHPSRGEIPTAARRQTLAGPVGELEVWVSRVRPDQLVGVFVLEFGGNAERAELGSFLPRGWLARHGAEVWRVNYPGYGGSEGGASLSLLAPAGLAAFDALAATAGDAPILIVGNSIGTTVALHVAAHRADRVRGVVLRNPPPLRSLILGRFGWWNLWLLAGPVALAVPSDLDSPNLAARVSAPGLVLSAADDEVVPAPYHRQVFDAYAGPKQLVSSQDSGHNDPLSLSAEAALAAWLEAAISPAR